MPSDNLQTTYLLPTDGFAKNANSGLNLKDIYNILSASNVESYVILDAWLLFDQILNYNMGILQNLVLQLNYHKNIY